MSEEPVSYLPRAVSESRLQFFLYLLLRDHLPAGVVEQLVREVSSLPPVGHGFSNPALAHYAGELARRISVPDR